MTARTLGDDLRRDRRARSPQVRRSATIAVSLPGSRRGCASTPAWADDLARLEAARVAVFGAADDVPLTLRDLQALASAEWPALRLSLVAATARIDTQHAVAEYWSAAPPSREPERGAEQYLVWRMGFGPAADHRRLESICSRARRSGAFSLADARPPPSGRRRCRADRGLAAPWVRDGVVRRALTREGVGCGDEFEPVTFGL